ncbi:hypothetical protein ILUMI_07150 [Ignelater luminosus]|uniref:Alcohol dehydrogenase n=1 Tax=Ignelater luminosus TaxID=2038154 RepID=A0A8K0GIB6_IGNLU|nr:hypothetical protein ILUMI_07150 [Ignelater luminosus]
MAFVLKSKISLITGGATGIGFCSVKELLRNGVKAVTIADIDEKRGQEALNEITKEFGPNRALFIKTDVTKTDQLEAAFQETINKWKAVDVVINNAAIMNDGQRQLEISLNCGALVEGSFLALKYMGKDKGGKGGVIVNMASIAGLKPADVLPVYCATKHFVVAFSRSLGLPYHYDRTGVRVLTLCPGATNTNLLPESLQHPLNYSKEIGERLDIALKNIPLQEPEYVAQAMATVITKGESGSVWVAEDSKPPYQVHIPDREELPRK